MLLTECREPIFQKTSLRQTRGVVTRNQWINTRSNLPARDTSNMNGFAVTLIRPIIQAGLLRAGLATAQIERARAGGQTRVHITNAGRRALRDKRAGGQWKSHA